MKFPKDFVWGAASGAIQIEGSPFADGGGESVWDCFCSKSGKIANGSDASIACDSYHRYEEDISLIAQMGLKAYRFSASWARINPKGDGNWNAKGLDYYDHVVNACLERGIEPYITLHHWELPQVLEDKGGWLNPDTAHAFGRFAGMMAERFKGRVRYYFTLNESQCIVHLGYKEGLHAPGRKLELDGLFMCWKHLMMAHGLAMRAIKAVDESALVGLASTGRLCYPETDEDMAAAQAPPSASLMMIGDLPAALYWTPSVMDASCPARGQSWSYWRRKSQKGNGK